MVSAEEKFPRKEKVSSKHYFIDSNLLKFTIVQILKHNPREGLQMTFFKSHPRSPNRAKEEEVHNHK